MKKISFVCTIFILLFLSSMIASKKKNPIDNDDQKILVPEGWELVWNDEFDSTAINLKKWEYEVNAQGGGNNELQYYTSRPENSYLENGCLVIKALKEHYTGTEGTREYTSARLRTLKKGDWKYGRFDIKAKLPYGKGIWPAIWMLPSEWKYGGWAASGEIDIMELVGHEPNKVYGTLHYGGQWPNNVQSGKSYTLPQGSFADDFHLFTIEWDTTQFRWYVDEVFYQSQTQWRTTSAPYPAPFDQYFHLLLNVAVGGNWPGNPDNTTVFPQKFIIDYVRVFKKTSTGIYEQRSSGLSVDFVLRQNYPNPFNSRTNIEYVLPYNCQVILKIINFQSQEIRTLVNEFQTAGEKLTSWDGIDHHGQRVSSGIYFYHLKVGEQILSRKMSLLN